MIILDNYNLLGRTAIISSEDIMRWDSRHSMEERAIAIQRTVEVLKVMDCIMFISSMRLSALPKEIRALFGDEIKPKANVYRFWVRDNVK